ncbi:hypothetical protein [Bdellovibrio sp.]|uniref:hypothetical protein n=1 Tax=Bdellovibrio sp. TaxID=28201 RepID=UPI0039E66B03
MAGRAENVVIPQGHEAFGGSGAVLEFQLILKDVIRILGKVGPAEEMPTPDFVNQLKTLSEHMQVVAVERTILDGHEVDAINYPHESPVRIEISLSRWPLMSEQARMTLVIHEALPALGLTDLDYHLSMDLAQKIFSFLNEGPRWKEEMEYSLKECSPASGEAIYRLLQVTHQAREKREYFFRRSYEVGCAAVLEKLSLRETNPLAQEIEGQSYLLWMIERLLKSPRPEYSEKLSYFKDALQFQNDFNASFVLSPEVEVRVVAYLAVQNDLQRFDRVVALWKIISASSRSPIWISQQDIYEASYSWNLNLAQALESYRARWWSSQE